MLERELVFLEQATGRGGQGQRQNDGILVSHPIRDRGRHVSEQDRVFLKSALGRTVAFLVRAHRVTQDTVADLEARDAGSDLDHFARNVGTDDERVLDPREEQVAHRLRQPVERIDRHSAVLDDNLVLSRGGVGRGSDLKRGVLRRQPNGVVRGHLYSPYLSRRLAFLLERAQAQVVSSRSVSKLIYR